MDTQHFAKTLDRMFAVFGKPCPRSEIQAEIWAQVGKYPDNLMTLALELLRAEDKMPSNLGGWITGVVWPEYKERNPQQITRRQENTGCPDCKGTGNYSLISPDGYETFFQCPCTPPAIPTLRPISRKFALSRGFRPEKRMEVTQEQIRALQAKYGFLRRSA